MDALVFVPPSQHLDPTRLRTELVRRLTLLKKKYEQIFVLFGLCFPDMDQILARFDAKRIRGEHCLEIAGGQLFWRIMKESPGSYFLIPKLVLQLQEDDRQRIMLRGNPCDEVIDVSELHSSRVLRHPDLWRNR